MKWPRHLPSRIVLSALFVLSAISAIPGWCGEALWPIQSLPADQIKKDWDFTPDAKWAEHIQFSCVKVTQKGSNGSGSGAFVSAKGLVITNRHCVTDALSELSTPARDLVRDGMYAATPAEELDCGLEIHVLSQVVDITAKMAKEFGPAPTARDLDGVRRKLDSQKPPNSSVSVVSYFGGSQFWLYVYTVFPAKLVFVPEEAFGAFGGEDDNFCYPRHKLDIAFLRAYIDGAPASSKNFFPLSPEGVHDGEQVFVAGHPGLTDRYMPVAQMEYVCNVEMPLRAGYSRTVVKALTAYMQSGGEQRKKAAGAFEHWANQLKLFEGSLAFMNRPEFQEARKKQEQQWRGDFGAVKDKDKSAQFLSAFDEIAEACKSLKSNAALNEFSALPQSRLFGLAHSLNSFAKATRGKPDAAVQQMAASFGEFLDHILDPAAPIQVDVEKVVLAAWLSAAKDALPADSPFIKTALAGRTPEEAAAKILEKVETLTTKQALTGLVTRGAAGIDEAKIPLLQFLADLGAATQDAAAEQRAAITRCQKGLALLERGLAEVYGARLPPNASSTLRVGWGSVCGYTEGGKQIPWDTTFASMIALSDAREHKPPYALSDKFKAAQSSTATSAALKLDTPLDFVCTADGAPGSSGSPIFSRDARLLGVLFDGNQQEVPSVYSYIPPETGGRCISVHSAAVWAALEQVYHCKALIEELKAGLASTAPGGN